MIVPFKVQFSEEEIQEYLERAKDILSHGALIPGKNNAELETMFAAYTGTNYAATVITGTTALEVIYRCLDLSGKEVLVPSNTNYATAEAVMRAGGKVILYDSDLYPDFASIKATVTPQTKAIVVVHIGGYITPEIEEIVAFCKEHNLYLIEDASHAHGSFYKGKSAGSFGYASAFSFFATKIITTSEGGIIVSNEKDIIELGKTYRDQGKDKEGIRNIVFGSAWRMSELHAALGIVQMKHIEEYIKRNNEIFVYYRDTIKTGIISIPSDKNSTYSGYKFIIVLENNDQRESLGKFMLENDIKPGKNVYDVPLHQQPALQLFQPGPFPKAEQFAQNHFCLPIWKGMTQEEVEKVVHVVNTWVDNNS